MTHPVKVSCQYEGCDYAIIINLPAFDTAERILTHHVELHESKSPYVSSGKLKRGYDEG